MAVRIGHASIDENRAARGGAAGDQTGKEVCIRSWYDGGWAFLARAKKRDTADRIAAACESGCANSRIGYDQNQRNSLNARAKETGYDLSGIEVPCETDCSAFVTVCIQAAGVDVPYHGDNAPTTATLKTVLQETGAFAILTDETYLRKNANLRRGDILVKPGKHTVVVLDDGARARIHYELSMPLLETGCSGPSVQALQMLLTGFGFSCAADGIFGPVTEAAVKEYQTSRNLEADGQAGGQTWSALLGIG